MPALVSELPSLAQIRQATCEVYAVMPPTPQFSWPELKLQLGREVWVKHENYPPVGAFKVRGGITYSNALRDEFTLLKQRY